MNVSRYDPLAGSRQPDGPSFDVALWGTVFLDIIFTGLDGEPRAGTEVMASGMGSCPGGIANLAVIHRLSDLDAVGDRDSEARAIAEGLLADCSTRVIYRQETDQLRGAAQLLGLTDVERQHLPRLARGVGLWKVADRSFLVGHQLSVREAPVFDTNTRMT